MRVIASKKNNVFHCTEINSWSDELYFLVTPDLTFKSMTCYATYTVENPP